MICCFLQDGMITFVNNTYCRFFNKKRKELANTHSQIKIFIRFTSRIINKSIFLTITDKHIFIFMMRKVKKVDIGQKKLTSVKNILGISFSSFAPHNQSSILYDFNLIENFYAKIGTGAIFANP